MKYFDNYNLIQEKLLGKDIYFINRLNIKNFVENDITDKQLSKHIHHKTIGSDLYLAYCYKEHIKFYKRAKPYENPTYNYIYKPNDIVRIFIKDYYHLKKLFEIFPKCIDYMNYYLSTNINNPELIIEKTLDNNITTHNLLNLLLTKSKIENENLISLFKENWDGFSEEEDHFYIFFDVIKNWEIVDGNKIRFGKEYKKSDFEFPEWIYDEIIRYTNDAGKKLNKKVKEWLLENSPKPTKPITIFRSYGISKFCEFGDCSDLTWKKVESLLYRRTGVRDITKLIKDNPIKVKRGKESSWSYNAEIAKTFAKGIASKNINFLVKSTIEPSDIVIDFTLLPKKYRDELLFDNQNEVIVDKKNIEGNIESVWYDKAFIKWLEKEDYKVLNGKGVFKNS